MSVLLIIIGLIILVKGADIFVDGSSQIAKKLNVSERIIGLTLVAFGTSFPELSISVIAALEGSDGLAIGNVVGSNIFNICFILGVVALIRPVVVSKSMIKKDMPMNILVSLVLFILLFDSFFTGKFGSSGLTRSDGLIFLLFFVVFLYYTFYSHINGSSKIESVDDCIAEAGHATPLQTPKKYNLWKNIAMIVLGLGGVLLGGDFVVRGSVSLAQTFGFSDTLIGLTIVSMGTSLPELITSIVAIKKGKDDIAVGNIVGSGIFNVLFIFGVASVISPLTLSVNIFVDVIVLIAASVLLFLVSRNNGKITKIEGLILLTMYVGYFVFIVLRG
ncbi:MAG: calcium/sodium antiporter [Bacteroidales bacterium]|jgi:cation:H+ antiporter|nr:calcium/sodium antiporter [Bacteroidales bacterium]